MPPKDQIFSLKLSADAKATIKVAMGGPFEGAKSG